jgi:hypothetical protein
MDEAAAAKYAEDLAKAVPLGGRGGLGLEANAATREKRKVSRAEKELLGAMKGRAGGLASMQTTVARAITHGNANFDPWKKPVKTSELHNVNTSKADLYSHFLSAGTLAGAGLPPARPSTQAGAGTEAIADEKVRKALKKALKANGGEMKGKALRKAAVEALLASAGLSSDAQKAVRAQVEGAIRRGGEEGKWSTADSGMVTSNKRKRA